MAAKTAFKARQLTARPDTLDFRDKMYTPSLIEVPSAINLETYRQYNVPILDQGQEGACTGFGLATVINYLLRKRKIYPDDAQVSPRMLYEMARRYDEWPGENYSGSSARGAMKGWHKHGVCGHDCWPYDTVKKGTLTNTRTIDALKRPLGAYYRVNHKDLVAMHSAIAEVGVLYATATVHEGWNNISPTGLIPYSNQPLGGHAFAIVAYDQNGFWIQNSWGDSWGSQGFAQITYDDWLQNGSDVWVARLGAPVVLQKPASTALAHADAAAKSEAYTFADLRPHIISIGNNGRLMEGGTFGTSEEELKNIFRDDFHRITANWKKKRLVLYAHGGLVSEKAAIQRLAEYRAQLLEAEVYPVSFIWHSDAWSTLTNVLRDALNKRKPEGFLDAAKDFLLDRLDDALEILARQLTGKLQWDEMKENALQSTVATQGGARLAAVEIAKLAAQYGSDFEIHIIGHSAGSIFHAALVQLLTGQQKISTGPLKGIKGLGLNIHTCTLWAPACTVELFKDAYLPAIEARTLQNFALFALSDKAEQDDHCAHIYNKSLLYLVSNAFEKTARIPLLRDGIPILGMQKFLDKDKDLKALFRKKYAALVLSPNEQSDDPFNYATSREHGGFDDDEATVKSTLNRILNSNNQANFSFAASSSALKDRRNRLNRNL
jgi:hypothetical protein